MGVTKNHSQRAMAEAEALKGTLIETREWVIDTRTSLIKLQDVVIGLLKRVQDLEAGK